MVRRRPGARILAAASSVLGLVMLTAAPAHADTAYGYNPSGCNFSNSGSKFMLKTRVTAWDYGDTVKIPGGKNTSDEFWNTGYLHTYRCSGGDTRERVDFKWTITASGWGIGCGIGIPSSVNCVGSSSERTLILADFTGSTRDVDGVLQRAMAAGSPLTFNDGDAGDTNKVCSHLAITSHAGAGERTSVEACADTD